MTPDSEIIAIDAHAHKLIPQIKQHRVALAGTTHKNSLHLLQQYSDRKNVFIGYGLHPWFVKEHEEERKDVPYELFDFIGEIGLDRGSKGQEFEKQCRILKRMTDIAHEHRKSICVHVVRSYGVIYQQLKNCSTAIFFHGYQGSEEFLLQFPNAFIGIGMNNIKHEKMKTLYKKISLSQVLFETDGNSSSETISLIVQEFSNLRGVSVQTLLKHQQSNFFRWIRCEK
jgi:Tat protein secretion system quality control protein TatD with DNase activity